MNLAGGGEFFGGMSGIHTLLPKMPGISYLSVFGGSMHSNWRDVYHGRKTLAKASGDSLATTIGMAPGLIFMNNAQGLYRLPMMETKIGLGMFGPTIGKTATAAGIHYLNKAGHHMGVLVGLSDPAPPETPWSDMSIGEKAAWATNEAIGWKFAFDMAGASEMRNIARRLGEIPKLKESKSTALQTKVESKAPPRTDPNSYHGLKAKYGEAKVKAAISMMTEAELLATTDSQLFKDAARMAGKTPEHFREMLELETQGTKASFLGKLGVKDLPAVTNESYIARATAKLKETGASVARVLDGQQGWTHDFERLDKKYQDTIVSAYKNNKDPVIQKNIMDHMKKHPQILLTMEARDLKFGTDSAYDANMLSDVATRVAMERKETPWSQVPNALGSGKFVNGEFLNVYGAGFAFYVRTRVANGTAKERTVATLLDNYHQAWESGEFTSVLNSMRKKTESTGTSLVPAGNDD